MPRGERRGRTAPAPEAEANGRDYSVYKDKPVTATMAHATEWLSEKTGYQLDERSVAIAVTLYHDFQASPENRQAKADRKAAREAGSDGSEEVATPRQTRGRKPATDAPKATTTRGRKPRATAGASTGASTSTGRRRGKATTAPF